MFGDSECGQHDQTERLKTLAKKLAGIRVLWRAPDTLTLWGLPYDLRPGQTPYDLFKASQKPHPTHPERGFLTSIADWVWLGQPGWWGHLDKPSQEMVEKFLEKHRDNIPSNPPEYAYLTK